MHHQSHQDHRRKDQTVEPVLPESGEAYGALFHHILNGLAYCRMLFEDGEPQDFIYLTVNDAFKALTGLTDVVGRKVTEVIPGIREADPDLFDIYARVSLTGKPERLEIWVEALQMWFLISVYSPKREYFIAVFDVITERKNLAAKFQHSDAHFRFVTETAHALIWMADKDRLCTWFNKGWLDFTGRTLEQERGNGWAEGVNADDLVRCLEIFVTNFDLRQPFSMEYRLRRNDGEYRWILETGKPDFTADEIFEGYIGSCFDISGRKESEESMRVASLVYQNSNEGMSVTDADGTIIAINPAFTDLTGYSPEEVIGKNPRILQSGHHGKDFYEAMWNTLDSTGQWQGEIWNRRKNGDIFPEWLSINTTFNEDGSVHRRVALFSDITKKKELEELLWQQANIDLLTGLPNRRMLLDRLEQAIGRAHRSGMPMALMFLDLDDFKDVNDTLGHGMGDRLLKEAAQRLNDCVRNTDTVARMGGDEFVVILSDLQSAGGGERVALEIMDKLTASFQLVDDLVYISASIGITLYPEDATNADDLLKNADQAMYAAKQAGKNGYHYFTPSMQQAAQTRMRLLNDLRGALKGQQLRVYYQPIIELATGRVHKAEALIRWLHPVRGMISPAEFIPLAEDTGLIVEIGDWVFRQAAQQVKRIREVHDPQFQISVNKSPVQFLKDSTLYKTWFDYLRELSLAGESIVIEITESLLMNNSTDVKDRLNSFRDAGIEVALDDFGTGYSSLSYLKDFDPDYLKIDQSFVRNLAHDSDNVAMCEAIIVMAHKLGIKVIAEGVETVEQCDLLTAAGCDYAQGYLFSKPIPSEEFESLLKAPAYSWQ